MMSHVCVPDHAGEGAVEEAVALVAEGWPCIRSAMYPILPPAAASKEGCWNRHAAH